LIQFAILLTGKYQYDKKIYLITEISFKLVLGLYIEYMLFSTLKGVEFEDKIIIGFASGLLLYDALFNDLIHLLETYKISIPSFLLQKG
jgi:hypothetical protein